MPLGTIAKVMSMTPIPLKHVWTGAGLFWAGLLFKQKSRLATAFCFSLLAAHPFQTAANLVSTGPAGLVIR